MAESPEPKAWSDWYRFARDELDCLHDECVEYANLRFVEEQNRAWLRAREEDQGRSDPRHRPEPRQV